jgi:hypothetical protein
MSRPTLPAVALGALIVLLVFSAATPSPISAQASCPPADCTAGRDVARDYFVQVVERLTDVSLSDFAVDMLVTWEPYEDTSACWNPLATTWKMEGSCDFNSAGVQHYLNQDMGIQATANTLNLGSYDAIRRMLGGEAFEQEALRAALATWGTCSGTACDPLLERWRELFPGQPSVNVAVIDSTDVINGGAFPTTTSGPTGSFTDFNFFTLTVGSVGSAALGPGGVCGASGCDTVLLNVASPGMACNTASLSAQQKSDLIDFVESGRKLIIYDSECVPQDYSWLPFSFTTANPGAQGAQGTLTIVENNTLFSDDPASPFFIDAAMLGSQTDAIGDMNVMTTYDPNWFLDMSGTNILGVSGPVHTYASLPPGTDKGLIIYDGLDVDYMWSSSAPNSATPDGDLAKIWLQELQQLFNPSDLPGTNPVIGIALAPETATHNVGQNHTVTATLTDVLGQPQPGVLTTFSVDSGPNAGATGACSTNADCTSDANGQVSFTYTGTGGEGTDQIKACFTNQSAEMICSRYVTAEWSAPIPPTERRAPFDFVTELSGLVNCNSEFTLGTGEAKVGSKPENGTLFLDLRARSLNGRADGAAGVGIRYTAPKDGKITISADVSIAGFDSLTLLGVPKLGDVGMTSVQSWIQISSVRIDPRRDNQHETSSASRLLTPDLLPIPGSPVDMVTYFPPQTFSDLLDLQVVQGDELFICVGVKSKVVATGLLPWVATGKVLYGPGKSGATRVEVIRVTYQ